MLTDTNLDGRAPGTPTLVRRIARSAGSSGADPAPQTEVRLEILNQLGWKYPDAGAFYRGEIERILDRSFGEVSGWADGVPRTRMSRRERRPAFSRTRRSVRNRHFPHPSRQPGP
jgi:hypothetical protein